MRNGKTADEHLAALERLSTGILDNKNNGLLLSDFGVACIDMRMHQHMGFIEELTDGQSAHVADMALRLAEGGKKKLVRELIYILRDSCGINGARELSALQEKKVLDCLKEDIGSALKSVENRYSSEPTMRLVRSSNGERKEEGTLIKPKFRAQAVER